MDGSCVGVARGYLAETGKGVRIHLRASPGVKRSGVKSLHGEHAIQISMLSPPEKGPANTEVEGLLAEVFGVGVSTVEVVRGASGRDKLVLVRGVSLDQVSESLDGRLDANGG